MTTVVFGLALSGAGAGIDWPHIALQFLRLALGGVVAGAVVGCIAAFLISENDRGLLRDFTPMVVALTVLAAYLISEQVHASGFMAAFVAGLMIGNAKSLGLTILPDQEHEAHQFVDAIGLKLRMMIFILLGSQVDFAVLQQYGCLPWPLLLSLCLLQGRSPCLPVCCRTGKRNGAVPKCCFFSGPEKPV